MSSFKTEEAFVLSSRPLGERSHIVSLITPEQGRHLGVLNKKKAPEQGTFVQARWQARLSDQLGTYYLEEISPFSLRYLEDKERLCCIMSLCSLMDLALPERQPFTELYEEMCLFLRKLDERDFMLHYILWETHLLKAIGFGLDLSRCAGGGDPDNLAYVSPKTGRAVSLEKGEPYKEKLLPLPAFMTKTNSSQETTLTDVINGLKLTGFFLSTYALGKQLPNARIRLADLYQKKKR